MEIAPQEPNDTEDRQADDRDISHAIAEIERRSIDQVIKGLQEQRAQPPVADIRSNLPVVFGRGNEILEKDDEREVKDHPAEVVSAEKSSTALSHRAPE